MPTDFFLETTEFCKRSENAYIFLHISSPDGITIVIQKWYEFSLEYNDVVYFYQHNIFFSIIFPTYLKKSSDTLHFILTYAINGYAVSLEYF